MKNLYALFLLPLILFSNAAEAGSSQKRLANETYQEAYNRVKNTLPPIKKAYFLLSTDSAVNEKVEVAKLDFSKTVEVVSHEELMHLFTTMRDSRFLFTDNDSQFARRISWLFPDDGCFARAAMSGIKLEEEQLTRPDKLYAFGSLLVNTKYSSEGYVSWWYHVAPVVKYMGAAYVLDPALNVNGPLTVDDWFSLMGNSVDLEGAVCNAYSYDPFGACTKANKNSESGAQSDQQVYLEMEWERMTDLGLDPTLLLGNNPPWLNT